jgi:hypothetical protein
VCAVILWVMTPSFMSFLFGRPRLFLGRLAAGHRVAIPIEHRRAGATGDVVIVAQAAQPLACLGFESWNRHGQVSGRILAPSEFAGQRERVA